MVRFSWKRYFVTWWDELFLCAEAKRFGVTKVRPHAEAGVRFPGSNSF
jgi:hypothetical protein